MIVLTPSYAPDFEVCADLARSVDRFAEDGVQHHIVVPRRDLALFRSLDGPRTMIRTVDEFLPSSFVRVPHNLWINARRPFPPVRGWIAQQIVKLAAAASFTEECVLLVDSDMVMVREFGSNDFSSNGAVQLYHSPGAITADNLPRHVQWHEVARSMLGLPAAQSQALTDYIGWPCAWSSTVCRQLLDRVGEVGRSPWATTVGSALHFSEMILYGVFAEEIVDPSATAIPRVTSMPTTTYDLEVPLSLDELQSLVDARPPTDLAIMVSAKSRTPITTRRQVWSTLS